LSFFGDIVLFEKDNRFVRVVLYVFLLFLTINKKQSHISYFRGIIYQSEGRGNVRTGIAN